MVVEQEHPVHKENWELHELIKGQLQHTSEIILFWHQQPVLGMLEE